jgi:hypothetical protein
MNDTHRINSSRTLTLVVFHLTILPFTVSSPLEILLGLLLGQPGAPTLLLHA